MKDWMMIALAAGGIWLVTRKANAGDGKAHEGGRIWSKDGAETFEGFDFGGNGLVIDVECERVAEGRHFFPHDWATTNTRAEEASTLDATLAIGRDNTAMGFVDYLTDTEGVSDPLLIAARILDEISPQCASLPEQSWGTEVRAWYDTLVKRITDYVGQETIG